MADRCVYCENELKIIKEAHKERIGEKTVIIKNTPVSYCNTCAEYFIDAKVLDDIETIVEIATKFETRDNFIVVDYEKFVPILDEQALDEQSVALEENSVMIKNYTEHDLVVNHA